MIITLNTSILTNYLLDLVNTQVRNIAELGAFKGLLNQNYTELNIGPEDQVYMELQSLTFEMENILAALNSTHDKLEKNKLINNLNSCRNKICITVHKVYLDRNQSNSTIDNL